MEVVQVGFHMDRDHRDPEDLLKAWPSLPGLARAVSGCGVRVTVVWPSHRDATFSMDGVTYVFASERPALFRRGTAGTRPVRAPASHVLDQVTGVGPDLIHVHGLTLPIHAGHLKRRLPRVKILAQDHADRPPRRWRRPLERKRMKAYDAVAFTAREQVDPFIRTRMISSTVPVFEVPESSTDFVPADRVEARRRTGIYGDPCLVWLGHLDGNKDPLTVLEGLSGAVSHLPDAHLWCCFREAPLLEPVRSRIESDPLLRGRVHLLGPLERDDVESLLQGADALVQGSHREGSGFAVLEAMACGLPIAAYPVTGPIDVVRDGETGCLNEDLKEAALCALKLNPEDCLKQANEYTWKNATLQFIDNLVLAKS